MSSEEPAATAPAPRPELTVTDPKAMRALAHPLRMALLELFRVSPTLTATQASEALGESPANCAFHLRTLAKYGFVEEAGGGRGRERPWRRMHESLNITSRQQVDPRARAAAEVLGSAFRDRWLDRIRRAFTARAWPGEWDETATASNSVRFLTPAEAVEMTAELRQVVDRYRDRNYDPASRPEGALPVDINIFSYPRADLSGITPDADGTQSQDIS
ncbi:MAG TPA: helix-turn-helix domain-containing protein [Trebonia sp.]